MVDIVLQHTLYKKKATEKYSIPIIALKNKIIELFFQDLNFILKKFVPGLEKVNISNILFS